MIEELTTGNVDELEVLPERLTKDERRANIDGRSNRGEQAAGKPAERGAARILDKSAERSKA